MNRSSGVLVVIGILFAGGPAAASSDWSVKPPAGWKDVSAEAAATPAVLAMQREQAKEGKWVEIYAYRSDALDQLTIIFTRAPLKGTPISMARSFEAGAHDKLLGTGTDTRYTVTETRDVLVVDEVATIEGRTTFSRRLIGGTPTALHAVMGFCHGPQAVCEQALASLDLDRAIFQPLQGEPSPDPKTLGEVAESSFQRGQALGAALLPLLLLAGLVWMVARRLKRKPKPAPGPPGP